MGSTACWHHEQKQVMTTQQIDQPSKSTKHADEDMKGQDTAPTGFIAPRRPAFHLPKLRWQHILAISIFRFALRFQGAALGIIILPGQALKMVGDLHKGDALAFVLLPGAFVWILDNPFFAMLIDQLGLRFSSLALPRP